VAVIDSGIHAAHPHVNRAVGGVAIAPDGAEGGDLVDRLGHGTAVTAAILERAPAVELVAVKVFDRSLRATAAQLVAAVEWCASRVRLANLSLGTANAAHEPLLREALERATAAGLIVVAARPDEQWLPGALPGVIGVELDWTCPRDEVWVQDDGAVRASGLPRPLPGVPEERNLKGASFAVAAVTGFVARLLEAHPHARTADHVLGLVRAAG
jgi:hypothetical protein